MTEAEFVAWVSDGLRTLGTVIGARVIAVPAYQLPKGGSQIATAQLEVILSQDGTTTTLREDVTLVLDGDAWKFVSIKPVP